MWPGQLRKAPFFVLPRAWRFALSFLTSIKACDMRIGCVLAYEFLEFLKKMQMQSGGSLCANSQIHNFTRPFADEPHHMASCHPPRNNLSNANACDPAVCTETSLSRSSTPTPPASGATALTAFAAGFTGVMGPESKCAAADPYRYRPDPSSCRAVARRSSAAAAYIAQRLISARAHGGSVRRARFACCPFGLCRARAIRGARASIVWALGSAIPAAPREPEALFSLGWRGREGGVSRSVKGRAVVMRGACDGAPRVARGPQV